MRHQPCLQRASEQGLTCGGDEQRQQLPGYRPRPLRGVVTALGAAAIVVTVAACTVTGGVAGPGAPRPAPHPAPRPAAPSSAPLELGVFEPGEWASYQPVARFAAATGHRPSIVLIYSGWPEPFQVRFAALVHAHHAEPFIQMEPVGASLAAIAAGKYDRYLQTYADQVRAFGHPVILSFAAEMNGSWYTWGYGRIPARLFVAAWRHVVDVFRAQGARNVTWLWTVNTVTEPSAPLRQWWPGAGYVDWVGIDGYFFRAADTYRLGVRRDDHPGPRVDQRSDPPGGDRGGPGRRGRQDRGAVRGSPRGSPRRARLVRPSAARRSLPPELAPGRQPRAAGGVPQRQ